LKQLHNLPPSV